VTFSDLEVLLQAVQSVNSSSSVALQLVVTLAIMVTLNDLERELKVTQ